MPGDLMIPRLMVRFTGERPTEGSTPDSLLALHAAGYREVRARLGPGRVLDTGCGLGEGTSSLAGSGRTVVGADYDPTTALAAHRRHRFPAAGSDAVKEDFARRRRTGRRLVALDVLDLRHKVPRRWYIAVYSLLLRIVYRLLGNRYSGGATGITADDFFLTDDVDDGTPVLFA